MKRNPRVIILILVGLIGYVAPGYPRSARDDRSDLQVYRHISGQWQRFVGHGRWKDVSPRNLPAWLEPPRRVLEGNFNGAAGVSPDLSGINRDEWSTSSEIASIWPRPIALGAKSAGSGSIEAADGLASTAERFGSPRMHGFFYSGGRFAQGWAGGAAGSFARGSGGWMQSARHAAQDAHASALGGHGSGGHTGGGASHR